jgi:hypothetical protein
MLKRRVLIGWVVAIVLVAHTGPFCLHKPLRLEFDYECTFCYPSSPRVSRLPCRYQFNGIQPMEVFEEGLA